MPNDLIEDFLSNELAKSGKLEGGLFAEVNVRFVGAKFNARIDFYTVKNGVVYNVYDNSELFNTGDTLYNVDRDCCRIGDYDPNVNINSISNSFSYDELIKLLKLTKQEE